MMGMNQLKVVPREGGWLSQIWSRFSVCCEGREPAIPL